MTQRIEALPVLLGASVALRLIHQDIALAAQSDSKVLITGESGVGKEVVARLIHAGSARNAKPLVTINCAGIPDTLLASELFGHVRGSFTGAYADKRGWLEEADHSTVFLDEVGEMSFQMQGLLLRFLENGEIQPVGSSRARVTTDVRVITATNRELIDRVQTKEFREDLYYRLNVLHIEIPPLRERPEDIEVLLDHFLATLSEHHRVAVPLLREEVRARLLDYSWPGNARQLRNVVERIVVRSRNSEVSLEELSREWMPSRSAQGTGGPPQRNVADAAFRQMMKGESFWTVVYQPFMRHDITRDDVRAIVGRALEMSGNNYRRILTLFNIPGEEHKRLLSFLRKFQLESMAPPSEAHRNSLQVREMRPVRRTASGE